MSTGHPERPIRRPLGDEEPRGHPPPTMGSTSDRDGRGGRAMYVFCVGMYRACSTWQYEVAAHLVERHRGGRRLGYLTGDQFEAMDDAREDDGRWMVLKSHEEHGQFARALADGRALAIY